MRAAEDGAPAPPAGPRAGEAGALIPIEPAADCARRSVIRSCRVAHDVRQAHPVVCDTGWSPPGLADVSVGVGALSEAGLAPGCLVGGQARSGCGSRSPGTVMTLGRRR